MGYKQWKIVTLTINTQHSTPNTHQLLAFRTMERSNRNAYFLCLQAGQIDSSLLSFS